MLKAVCYKFIVPYHNKLQAINNENMILFLLSYYRIVCAFDIIHTTSGGKVLPIMIFSSAYDDDPHLDLINWYNIIDDTQK
jgi:hypothetical protein